MGLEAFNEGRISLMINEWGIGFGSFQCEGEESKVLRWNWTLEREQEQKERKEKTPIPATTETALIFT